MPPTQHNTQGGPKNVAHFFVCLVTSSNIDNFQTFFFTENQEKICNNTVTKIPPHLKSVTTLPCEMSVP